MVDSILTSVKKILGLGSDYTAFDQDILMHINAAFAIVNQLGVGPDEPIVVEDAEMKWDDIDTANLPTQQLSFLKAYIYLKVRLLFDPPATSFHLDALNNQITEYEYRLSYAREVLIPLPTPMIPPEVICYDF